MQVQSTSAMNIISAVLLLALSAVEPLSAATTGRPPWGTCTTKQEGDMCVLIDVPPPCGHYGVAIFNHTPPCTTCECVPTPSKEKPVELCCDTKTVGDYKYTKVHSGSGKVPSRCMNDCVYTRDGHPGPKYCFEEGEQEVHCLDHGDEFEEFGLCTALCNVAYYACLEGGFGESLCKIAKQACDFACLFDIETTQHIAGQNQGKNITTSVASCGRGGTAFNDFASWNSHGLFAGANFNINNLDVTGGDGATSGTYPMIQAIQGIYGNVRGPVRGGGGQPNCNPAEKCFTLPIGVYINAVEGTCVQFTETTGVRDVLGSLTFTSSTGNPYIFGDNEVNIPATQFKFNPPGCKLAFISGRSGKRVDQIQFHWEC